MQITDISPKLSSTLNNKGRSPTGRMLAIAGAPDGSVLFVGSYSNLWASYDGGQTWTQLTWPQPAPDQFDAPGSLGGWCVVDVAVALGWRVENPRMLGTLTSSGHADIVGFGNSGVWTALGNGDGSFQEPNVVLNDFGYQAGGWQVELHPRFLATLTNSGYADIVGFGDAGVWTALGKGDGTFQSENYVIAGFGVQQGWQVTSHPRFVVDLTGNGHADIVGFGNAGVAMSLGNGDGTFQPANFVLADFGVQQGWQVASHPRFLAVLTSSGHPDIVGFGDAGVWTALGNGDGTFQPAKYVLANFGVQQGWQVSLHPRFVVDLTGNGHADIVGFGDAGVWTALGNGDGTFQPAKYVLADFGVQQGWQVASHPRYLAVLTSSGHPDIVGFGDAGVWTARGNGDGTFQPEQYVLANFGVQQAWQVDRHPRLVGSFTKGGLAGIVAFGDAGVWTAAPDGQGGFPASNYVLANLGYQNIVLAMTSQDRIAGSRGIWRSTDSGATWVQVYKFSPSEYAGQLEWALGSDHLVYAACGSSLAVSRNAGATFAQIFPWGGGPAKTVNHVAVWQNAPADPTPAVIYALGNSSMFVSFDGGVSWIQDHASLPSNIGGATSLVANSNSAKVMAISPVSPRQVYIAANGSGASVPATLYLFDYSQFPSASQSSTSRTLALPAYLEQSSTNSTQDSGNVFLAATQPGRGNLLFYGAQRQTAYVGPLQPASGSDWHALDSSVHWDLHGILLSSDFAASLANGSYTASAGTVWLLSDGGVNRSTDGGNTFLSTNGPNTLSSVNVAVAAQVGGGPAFSLNTGDNDGFYSMDGGQTWSYQQYGGGDNDTSFHDPQRPYSMLVCTPRWNTSGNSVRARDGQTVTIYEAPYGSLPNASVTGTSTRHIVPSPPLPPDSEPFTEVWNANSYYNSRGSRPIVLGRTWETPPAQGDYIFILNPTTQPVLARTQSILNIKDGSEWRTSATAPGQGANVYLQGPPLPVPASGDSLGVVQASGGHAATVFYIGGNAESALWTWTQVEAAWRMIVPNSNGVGATSAVRFFASPYNSDVIYILDSNHVKVSVDRGNSWFVDVSLETQLTWNGQIAISSNDNSSGIGDHFDLILTDMAFHPVYDLVRYAVGEGGVFCTIDGVNWTRLLHAGAFPGRPANCCYGVTNPRDPALYVSFAGRSLVEITELPDPEPVYAEPNPLTFPEQQVGTTSAQLNTTVFANWEVTLTGLSFADDTPGAAADFACVPEPGTSLTVPANGQLDIAVWFRPTAGGVRNAKLQIAHNLPGSPWIVNLSGTGNAAPLPLLSVSPTSLFFTTKKITNHTVTLTNTGTGPLTINSIAINGASTYSFVTTCNIGPSGGMLNPGQQCTITVSYHFVGPGGSSELVITHDAVGSPTIVDLEADGAGGGPPP
ncbi:MAG: choice-of-anchor D domain-containing protein [Bryobacteraceae bacterium]